MAAIVAVTALSGGGCARSAANMAATQPEAKDLSVLVKGVPRDKIVARLGAPEATTQHGELTAEVFKFVQGYSGGARTARVFAHSTLSIATFGLWEVAGTAIEGYARGNTISVRCVYDKHRLLETYEFLEGEELSLFALVDGKHALALAAAQDHKRAFDGDKGPNTGGMGAYAPAPVFTETVRTGTMTRIIEPVLAEMRRRGTPYRGVLFAGLMIAPDGPKLIEFNCRFGDPECQALMRLLKSDLLPVLHDAATGNLKARALDWSADASAVVVMAAKGYPGPYEKGSPIRGLDAAQRREGVIVFHAGTAGDAAAPVAAGGRVLNVTATGHTIRDAVERAYKGVSEIDWPEGFFRRDIGWRALKALL